MYSAKPGSNLDSGRDSCHWQVSLSRLHMVSYSAAPMRPGTCENLPSDHIILPFLNGTFPASSRCALNFPFARMGSPGICESSFWLCNQWIPIGLHGLLWRQFEIVLCKTEIAATALRLGLCAANAAVWPTCTTKIHSTGHSARLWPRGECKDIHTVAV